MKKGFVNFLEIVFVAIIVVMAFLHFFPQYQIKTDWEKKLLEIELRDTMVTIDRLEKTHEFATDKDKFQNFMNNIFGSDISDSYGTVYLWWDRVEGIDNGESLPVPYYTRGAEKTIIDTFPEGSKSINYTFTVGLGTPY